MTGFWSTLRSRTGFSALLFPAILILGLVYILPLGRIALLSVDGWNLSPRNYERILSDGIFYVIFVRTIWIAVVVTAISLFLGYPLAVLIAKAPPRIATILLLLVVIPMWTSILVRSYSWMVILGREGIVNSVLEWAGLIDEPLKLLYNRFSVYVGMVHIMLPFMVLPILNNLRQIPPSLARAAGSLGATPLRAFALIYLPLSMPGIAAGTALVMILSLGFFVTPALLGGTTDTTFVLLIDRYVRAIRDWEMASAMSMLLLVAMLLIVLALQFNPARNGSVDSGTRPSAMSRFLLSVLMKAIEIFRIRGAAPASDRNAAPVSTSRRQAHHDRPGPWVMAIGGAALVFLCFPLVIIVILAFSDSPFLKFPPTGFSLRWFENFFSRQDWIDAAWNSVQVGILTMILATLAGSMAAIVLVRSRFRGRGLLFGLMMSPVVVPVIVLAIAIYFVFAPLGLVGTRAGLVLAHSVLAMPFVIIVVSGALQGTDISLERAARTLGAPPISAFLRITLPAIRPAVITGAFFAFLASFDELVIALFIAGTGSRTLPKRMWEGIREEIDPTIAAVAAMLIAMTLVLILVSEFIRARTK